MAKRSGESTADDLHGWILQSWLRLMKSPNIAIYRYHGIFWDGILSSGVS